ncbi:MAG: hypothetical protein JO126_02710 [Alphaproteobacteria bacterium]|nr:hypothetical protein [Alphaproteobacteria bacterium]MBV8548352.1 hypothetical protein [Alphaproteobacteria bacterium]
MRFNKRMLFSRCSVVCLSLATGSPAFLISNAVADNCATILVNDVCLNTSSDIKPATIPNTVKVATSGPDEGLTHDANTPGKDFNQCAITASNTSAPCFGNNVDLTGVHTAGSSDGMFDLARIDPGVMSDHAIDLYGICRYVDKSNTHNTNSIVIPFKDYNGWNSFTHIAPQNDKDLHMDMCIRGGKVTTLPAVFAGDPRNMLCNNAILNSATLPTAPYRRYAANSTWISTPTVSYSCRSADGTPFTETVIGTYSGGMASDPASSTLPASANQPTTWTLSGITTSFPGQCGGAAGVSVRAAPTTGLCHVGVPSSVSAANNLFTWTCSGGSDGTNTTSCSAPVIIDAACGISNTGDFLTAPTGNLCSDGSLPAVTGTGPWFWTCLGTNGGNNASCTANKTVNGACGAANGVAVSSAPANNLCSVGTPSGISGSGPWTWSCAGQYGGPTAFCNAPVAVINGTCGSSNGGTFANAPSTNLCNSGTATNLSGSGPWTWSCAGSNNGGTASCAANLAINISVTRGQLHWDNNWTGNNFWCDPGYKLVSMHFNENDTNNANWYECQGQVPASVVQSGNVPVVGILHWDNNWTGDNFWCDAGYHLVSFHYDCGCTNNADWYECQGTVSPNNYVPLTGETHWDGNWTGNNFWCDAPFTAASLHYDCHCTNNADWYSCQVMPTAGVCGSSNGVYSAGAPTSGLCSTGAASAVSGSNPPYTWTCAGTYGGATTSCATNACPDGYVLSNGSCVQQVCGTYSYTLTCLGGSSNWQDCDYDNCGNLMDCYSDPGCS